MAALIRRTRLGAFLRHPRQRRTRPPGYRPEHRENSGPRRNCYRGHECPCRARYAVGIGPAAPVSPAPALLAQTMLLHTIRSGR